MSKKDIITNEHLQFFIEKCNHYINLLEMNYINFQFCFLPKSINNNTVAKYQYNETAKSAVIGLHKNPNLTKETNIYQALEKAAFHEICEILLSNVKELAEHSFNKQLVESEIHTIINKLFKAIKQ